MKQYINILFFIVIAIILSACGGNDRHSTNEEELILLEVEFTVPETVEVGETFDLLATVTYGEEFVDDADDVTFEIWEQGHEDDSIEIEAINNGDGKYRTELTLEQDGIYEMYAHVTARGLHTMPKKSVTVGDGEASGNNHDHGHDHGEHTQGFAMHFVEPENATVHNATNLLVHIQMDDLPLEAANVRFEIWNDAASDKHEWIETEETTPGEYAADVAFDEAGDYHVVIHVENDDGLHEHQEQTFIIME